jgi:hypothetical protein
MERSIEGWMKIGLHVVVGRSMTYMVLDAIKRLDMTCKKLVVPKLTIPPSSHMDEDCDIILLERLDEATDDQVADIKEWLACQPEAYVIWGIVAELKPSYLMESFDVVIYGSASPELAVA